MSDYQINVFWSDEDESWVADIDIPDLAHCSALGATPPRKRPRCWKRKPLGWNQPAANG